MLSVSADPTVDAIDPERIDDPRPAPEWHVLARLEKTAIGTRGAGGVATVRRREPAGCLLYGPYWQLPTGAYRLNFRCQSGKPRMRDQPVLGVEIIALNRIQLAWRDLTADELRAEQGSLEFSVPVVLGFRAGDEARLEFRFFHLGNADLAITAVDLLGIAEPRPAPPRTWRMLGRLETTTIGRRTGAGVMVRRMERAGLVLEPGRPYLQLPTGHYRLAFRCAACNPKLASQPVLGVEVVAWRRWGDNRSWRWKPPLGSAPIKGVQQAWSDFTAAQLESRSGSIDFTVPTELSLEGGEEALFGFRFFHLHNADLTISAVDLQRLSAEEAAPAAMRRWRMLGRLSKARLAARREEGVKVGRAVPSTRLLYGGRPALRLPKGRYRLSFGCRAGPSRAPVLRVDIIARTGLLGRAHRGWRPLLAPRSLLQARREFTAGMLQDGLGSIDFEVPDRLALDGEDPARFELNFHHLGNADLTITAVDLQELGVDETAASRPPLSHTPARTRVLIVGNCQAQTVYEALFRTRDFNTRLDMKYHFVGLQSNLHQIGKEELERCDILLVQDIRDWEHYPLRPFIRDKLPIVKFPLLHFASLWPFDHYNGPGDKEAYDREYPNLTFLYLDGLLGRLRKEIPDPEQRLVAYRSLEIDGVLNFARLHDFEKRRLIAMDQQFGFDIGRFILDNFQRKRLFHTTNHPNGTITAMLMQYLLKHVGIDEGHRPIALLDHLKKLQVPVHPKVARELGVQWATEITKYLYEGEQITWETYIRRYIDHYG